MANVTIERERSGFFRCLNPRVTPQKLVCFLALLTPVFVIFNLQNMTRHALSISKCSNCSETSVPSKTPETVSVPSAPPTAWIQSMPFPNWATKEEIAQYSQSMARWGHTVGLCNGCNAYRYTRIINPKSSTCSPTVDGKTPELLILVSTIHRHTRYRTLIRETWASHTQNNTGRARLVFLLGLDPGRNLTDEKLLQKEGETYGDIIQDSFNSTYRRGGEIQLIMGYHWAVEQCSNVTHVLKVSDDTFVSIPKVLELITKTNLGGTIWGQCYSNSHPLRDKKHRWYVSVEDWPPKLYPRYCAGAYLGITMPVIRKILLVSPHIAWFSGNDDVLLGMCAEKVGIPTKGIAGFRVWDRINPCHIGDPKYAIHFHGISPEVLKYFWERRDCFEGGKVHRGPKNDPVKYVGK